MSFYVTGGGMSLGTEVIGTSSLILTKNMEVKKSYSRMQLKLETIPVISILSPWHARESGCSRVFLARPPPSCGLNRDTHCSRQNNGPTKMSTSYSLEPMNMLFYTAKERRCK